jgi:uncharacterized membrane protein YbhN (UPF0104 family)
MIRRPSRTVLLTILALGAGVGAALVSGVANIGGRLARGRPVWIVLAAGLELASALGFVATFQLVFGEWLPRRMSLRAGLVVLAATILVPAGALVSVGVGSRALRRKGIPGTATGSRAIAFLLITNAPNLIVLGVLGMALGVGLLDGPHAPVLTILPAAIALSVMGLTVLLPKVSRQRDAPTSLRIAKRAVSSATTKLELGVLEARALLRGRSLKLLGAAAYYAADNAVLWATFRAFGHAHPPIATFAMAYLIGSAAGSLPVPGGIGVVEGGMIGALVLYGAPAACAGIAVLAYRAVSTGLPLALGAFGLLTLCRPPRLRSRRRRGQRRISYPLDSASRSAAARASSMSP